MTKIQDKKTILKAAREKQQIIYKGTPIHYKATVIKTVWYCYADID